MITVNSNELLKNLKTQKITELLKSRSDFWNKGFAYDNDIFNLGEKTLSNIVCKTICSSASLYKTKFCNQKNEVHDFKTAMVMNGFIAGISNEFDRTMFYYNIVKDEINKASLTTINSINIDFNQN